MAADLSARHGWISHSDVERIRRLLAQAQLPVDAPADISREQFLNLMAVDKKALDGGLRLILLDAIGKAKVCADFDPGLLHQTLEHRVPLTGS